MSRTTPLFMVASIAFVAACSDRPEPTAPARANAIVTTSPNPAALAVTVEPPVTLEGFAGSSYDIAHGVNAFGDVAGVSSLGGVFHAVQWRGGSTAPNDVAIGRPLDINAAGQLAGEAGIHAALWTPDGAGGYALTNIGEKLPLAVTSIAYGMNASGQVVGTYRLIQSDGSPLDRCFLWTPDKPNGSTGTVTTLPDLGGSFCVANDINSAGYVVGAATTAKGETHGFVWSPSMYGRLGKIRDLTPDGGPSYATAINDLRQIAGQHTSEVGASAAIWTPTAFGSYAMTELGTFTGNESLAMDINDAGFVVGWARRNDVTEDDAFLWQNGEFTLLPGVASFTDATALAGLKDNSVDVIGGSYDPGTGARTALRWTVKLTELSSSR